MTGQIASHIEAYLKKNIYPMHMPGHKRNAAFFPSELIRYDMTEFGDMDNLHAPSGVIAESQKQIAGFYGADWSRFLINGATAGLTAAIAAVCSDNDGIIVGRNSHRSVFGGLVLSGARPVYVWPEMTPFGLSGGISPERIKKAFMENEGVKAVVITSPTYEGFVSDIEAIADVTHQQGAVLIVDEAHGAHFPFHSVFPPSALSLGADIVVNSLHKTLPIPSQCAVLHGRGSRADLNRVQPFLSVTQSSSPSYIFMTLMDQIITLLREDSRFFEQYVKQLLDFRMGFAGRQPLELIGKEVVGQWGIQSLDVGKLVFLINGEMDGPRLEKRLVEDYGVQIEMCGTRHILAMTSVADEPDGFAKLAKGIREIGSTLEYQPYRDDGFDIHTPEMVYTPRKGIQEESISIDLEDSVGMIAADFIIPYPPGMPLIVPGERLTDNIIDRAVGLAAKGIEVMGAENNRCRVILKCPGKKSGHPDEADFDGVEMTERRPACRQMKSFG